ncbi:hypothetical protein FB451DRAFT_1135027 [Mycena latifolia]|nr:hypothetical protein FB451DRAFT_1135027 [Mycena latifolia]
MYHTAFRGMDAIDYEPDTSLIDGPAYDYDYDDDDDGGGDSDVSGGSELEGCEDWDSYSEGSDDEIEPDEAPHDLRNPKTFPAFAECAPIELYETRDWDNQPVPPPRHWCYLGEIVENMSSPLRNVLTVQDKDCQRTHLSSNFDLEAQFDVKVGSMIAVMYAEKKYFSFGVYSLRLDHAKFVKIFPCNLQTLLRINDDIESETPVDSAKKCKGCGKDEEPNTKLLRCSRCLGASYCGKECQLDAWKGGHKRECKMFAAVIELKGSRDWGRKKPLEWVAFGERETPRPDTPDSDDPDYRFQPQWKDANSAVVKDLQGTFTITSGEFLWGQLTSILQGLMTDAHDFPSTDDRTSSGGGTVLTQGYTYRAPAKVGVWKLAKVNGFGHSNREPDSWLAYHSSCDPLELVLLARPVCWDTRAENPRVCWVNRYDWGYHCADASAAARFFADIDPDSGWGAANAREKRLHESGSYRRKNHPDNERWDRLEEYASDSIFLVDAAHGPEVLKAFGAALHTGSKP